ncbi:VQ motif-containing protein motif-containing protein 4 [Forsythia ovata]|uniref:VQ motif-containing protein motif-containing protein 4 n=1 Tax=Forsythia ovata TaxID=205694 RepID=A0ABD1S9K3_9LAMI
MEIISRAQERENNQSPTTSPNSNGSSSNSYGSLQVPTPPLTPNPIPRSDTNPYPTTFVQADTSTFKQVVQMLTGSSETAQKASKSTTPSDPPPPSSAAKGGSGRIPPIKSTGQKKPGFKLYERRNSLKNGLMINTLIPSLAQNSSFSPREHEILSPSILDFPSLVLSPVTPLNEDTLSKSSPSMGNASEEEKAIAEKKFYLHPSPRTTPRDSKPQLLPLFPVTSPRVSGSSS